MCFNLFYVRLLDYSILLKARQDKLIHEMIIMGNANLCSAKWKEPNFVHKKIANQLIGCLDHCELIQKDVGITFQADHIQSNGLTSESELDHVFILINYYYYYFNHFE